MKNETKKEKIAPAILGLLILMACVLLALIGYWVNTVIDITEKRKLAEGAVSYSKQIYNFAKFPLT